MPDGPKRAPGLYEVPVSKGAPGLTSIPSASDLPTAATLIFPSHQGRRYQTSRYRMRGMANMGADRKSIFLRRHCLPIFSSGRAVSQVKVLWMYSN